MGLKGGKREWHLYFDSERTKGGHEKVGRHTRISGTVPEKKTPRPSGGGTLIKGDLFNICTDRKAAVAGG